MIGEFFWIKYSCIGIKNVFGRDVDVDLNIEINIENYFKCNILYF